MKRIIFIGVIAAALLLGSCSSNKPAMISSSAPQQQTAEQQQTGATGRFPIQSVAYNDLDGTYELQLFERVPPILSSANVKMVPLAEDEEQSYAEVQTDQTILHLAKDAKIAYISTETVAAPAGEDQPQTVVVQGQRQSFWQPFAEGYLISQIFGGNRINYVPMAVYPPAYQAGQPLRGVGGYGRTYESARADYQKRNKVEPPSVRYSKLRTSGKLTTKPGVKIRGTTARSIPVKPNVPTKARTTQKPSGSGIGSSNLRNKPSSPNSGFRRTTPSRSFGSSRRRSFGGSRPGRVRRR